MPPGEPRHDINRMFSVPGAQFLMETINPPKIPALDLCPKCLSARYSKQLSYEVDYRVKNLKHGYIEKLGCLMVLFPSRERRQDLSMLTSL